MKSISFFLIATITATFVQASPQFHLSLPGDETADYFLDWVTPTKDSTPSKIYYGYAANELNFIAEGIFAGEVEEESNKTVFCWSTQLKNLEKGKQVFYSLEKRQNLCDDGEPNEKPKSFVAYPAKTQDLTWAVFADMGSLMKKGPSGISVKALEHALLRDNAYQAMLNIGDFAYAFTQENGKDYMESLAEITARVPMQATSGNHEYRAAPAPFYALRNYRRRFTGQKNGLGVTSGTNNTEYFSFDSGLVHFAVINTEMYGRKDKYFYETGNGEYLEDESLRRRDGDVQLAWLENDFKQVDRKKTPFLVLVGHRSPFETPKTLDEAGNFFGKQIVPLMDKYQVDLYICGHTHRYMILKPSVWNGYKIPPVIVAGSFGNYQGIDPLSDLKLGHFEAEVDIPIYGFGLLKATPEALEWKYGSAASDNGTTPSAADWKLEHEYKILRKNIV